VAYRGAFSRVTRTIIISLLGDVYDNRPASHYQSASHCIASANFDVDSPPPEAAGSFCGGQDAEHEDEEECTNTQHGPPLLESFDDDMLLQESVCGRGKIQVVEVMGESNSAATAPPMQSGGVCGRVSAGGGEADHVAACGDDTRLASDMVGVAVELIPQRASASPAAQQKHSRFRGVSWSKNA
jgi:hypothetical protein